MMQTKKFFTALALPTVIFVAFLNHLLIFLAYDWYAGIDSYSYDVCGLQLVSGYIFDPFPVIYRPPLTPLLKNILYLIFEGHPYALSLLLHLLGIGTIILVYRLGARFHKIVGFAVGLLAALNLQIALFFHSISSLTFYLPLVVLALDRFVVWITKPSVRALFGLIIITFACSLMLPEGVFLIPIFFIFGLICHRNWKQVMAFLIICMILYNLVCFCYYLRFGYWSLTYKTGWSLFNRVTRKHDQQFDINNGPASRKIYEYMQKWLPNKVSADELAQYQLLTHTHNEREQQEYLARLGIRISLNERQMYTFNVAQQELGYIKADDLFKKASLEGIFKNPYKFLTSTFIRMLAQLDVYSPKDLSHPDYYLQKARFCYTQKEQDMEKPREWAYRRLSFWKPPPYNVPSPLQWERKVLLGKVYRLFNFTSEAPTLPDSCQIKPNFMIKDGQIYKLNCGDCVMTERLWNCRDLDVYFFLIYWGPRWQSQTALKFLKYWDNLFMHSERILINLYRLMWIFFIIGIFITRNHWHTRFLLAVLCIILFQATIQAVFSDNFGGRHSLYTRVLLLLGALYGILAIIERLKNRRLFC